MNCYEDFPASSFPIHLRRESHVSRHWEMVSYFSTINLQAAFHQKRASSVHPCHLGWRVPFADKRVFEWKLSAGKCSSVKAPYGAQGTQAMINRLYYCQFLYSMFYCLVSVCPYRTSVQDIADSKMLRRAAKSSMFNSCVNPLIYWATNKEYRDELFELFKFANIKWSARNSYYLEYQMSSLGSSTLSQQSQT